MEPTKEDEWQWFDLDNLPEKLYSTTRKFIERYLKLRKQNKKRIAIHNLSVQLAQFKMANDLIDGG